jgi:glycosyltransferase involved in cell wall biosynthesis
MVTSQELKVELVEQFPGQGFTGIGRFIREIFHYLNGRVSIRLVNPQWLPLSNRFAYFKNFPLSLRDHQMGSVVHFTQIVGLSQMLWNPVFPSVATIHDLGVLTCKEDEVLFKPLDRRTLDIQFAGIKKIGHFTVNSEKTKEGLVNYLNIPEQRINFVQLGVDTQSFRPIENSEEYVFEKYRIRKLNGGLNFIYVGSELPRKNFSLILNAVALLKNKGYPIQLIKVGGAGGRIWREETISTIQRFALQENVRFVENVPEEDLPFLYNMSDICVTATLLEGGFAWTVMEALGCGKAAISSEGGNIPVDARSSVIVVPDRNLEALVTEMESFYYDTTKLVRMQVGARNIVLKYTWEATAESMLKVYSLAHEEYING